MMLCQLPSHTFETGGSSVPLGNESLTQLPVGVTGFSCSSIEEVTHGAPQLAKYWLHDLEYRYWESLNHIKRRNEFLAGRYSVKQLIFRELGCCRITPRELLIVSPSMDANTNRPEVYIQGKKWCGEVAISHSDNHVAIAIGNGTHRIGLDLVEPPSYPTLKSHLLLSQNEQRLGNWWEIWSIKEAAYKASSSSIPFRPADWHVLDYQSGKAHWIAPRFQQEGTATILSSKTIFVNFVTVDVNRNLR